MVDAVAALLASSLTTIGLLVIWAATSRGNWFWRTAMLLVALAPLLVVSATEPLATFVIQATIVIAGIRWTHWTDATREPYAASAYRFSVRDILLLCVVVSIVAASASLRVPSLNAEALQSTLCIGVAGGLASLVGWWIGTKKANKAWIRFLVGAAVWVLIGSATAGCDWFVFCFDNLADWPPDKIGGTWGFYGEYDLGDRTNVWYLTLGWQILFTVWVIRGLAAPFDSGNSWKRRVWRKITFAFSLILLAVVPIPSLHVGYHFLARRPLPTAEIPEENGYVELLEARKLLPAIRLVDDVDFYLCEADESQLLKASADLATALDRVAQGLEKPTSVLVDYHNKNSPYAPFDDFYTFMRGFAARARAAKLSGDAESAAESYLDILALANSCCRGGFVCHGEAAMHFDYVGYQGLYRLLDELPADRFPEYADRLRQLESDREPADYLVHRSEAWVQRSGGWYDHLMHIYGLWLHYRHFELRSYIDRQRGSSTISHLLQSEIALRRYASDRGEWPETLQSLVPQFLLNVPGDPFSRSGSVLRYARKDDGYLLYSVGPDGEDDYGESRTVSLSYAVHGDTSLSDLFRQSEEEAEQEQ